MTPEELALFENTLQQGAQSTTFSNPDVAQIMQGFSSGVGAPAGPEMEEPPGYLGGYFGGSGPVNGGGRSGAGRGYREGVEWQILQSMSPEAYATLQEKMNALGLLGDYVPGQMDDRTVNSFRSVLSMANRTGGSWQDTVAAVEEQVRATGALVEAVDEPGQFYQLPDYATLGQTVKQQFRQQLKRDPTQAEMQLLVNDLMGNYEAANEQMMAIEENIGAGRSVMDEQIIDPGSRFLAAFEEKYQPEIQSNEEQETVGDVRDATTQNIAAVANAAGV